MSFQNWWRRKSGQSKTITILATLMILQIGLCFGTPTGVSWYRAHIHSNASDDPLEAMGMMAFEAILCIVTGLVLALVAIFWRPGLSSPSQKKENP